ncbi:MAG: MGMT family protein [candidate division KSB1 bacterium]|nr:MGMT family protein [candidate division KSB1 bacterium]
MTTYDRIYQVIKQIPRGKVATYGQIARIVGDCSARMVGYALSALHEGTDVPWQRVINRQGKISLHPEFGAADLQRRLLESEGVSFDARGCIDLSQYGWPDPNWL